MLMIINHFAQFQLPGFLLKTKKNVLPISVATRNFLFIYNSDYEVHQVGPKDSGSQNFSFLAFKGEAVGSI
jgi:hypothetical protein